MTEVLTFKQVCGRDIGLDRVSYQYQMGLGHKRKNPADGSFVEITLPKWSGLKRLAIDDKNPPETPHVRLICLSDVPDFDGEFLTMRTVGSGSISLRLDGSEWSGKKLYFGNVILDEEDRYDGWISQHGFYFR